jgi:hypothetical protein
MSHVAAYSGKQDPLNCPANQPKPMTKSDPDHNEYECPVDDCGEWVSVALPVSKYVTCPSCNTKLEIHPDAEFFDEHWHDRTHLSVVDPEREHMKKMLNHLQQHANKT